MIDGIWTMAGIQVKKCGYLPFRTSCPNSEHRALCADFTYRDIFGYDSHPFVSPAARQLHTRDPPLVEKYNREVTKRLTETGLDKSLEQLKQLVLNMIFVRSRQGDTERYRL